MVQNPLNILYEDSSLAVCAKPHGIATQSRNISARDMESMLKTYISQQRSTNTQKNPRTREPYLAVIHRLDQPVSGILVFAKTQAAAKALSSQLQNRQFRKYYRALTDGIPPREQGVLEDHLVKNGRTNSSQICSPDSPGAKYARLEYQTISVGETILSRGLTDDAVQDARFFKDASPQTAELEIHLDTGRHHQIRVQLAAIGCPIIGDAKYHPLPGRSGAGAPGLQRPLMLCAFHLEFLHPVSGAPMVFHLTEDVGSGSPS